MVQELYSEVQKINAEIRRLRGRLDRISIGGQIIPSGTIPISSGGGGTGIIGSPLGVTVWENNSGGTLSRGAVVVHDGNRLFDTTVIAANLDVIGVLDGSSITTSQDVLDGANGRVRHVGYQDEINVVGAVAVGDYLTSSTTAGRAESIGSEPAEGVFAVALTSFAGPGNSQVAGYVFPVVLAAGTGGGSGPIYIPLGSEADDGAAVTATFDDDFDLWGWVTRLFNPADYSFDPLRIVLEVVLKSSSGSLTAKARLWDITDAAEVSDSRIVTVSTTPVRLRSGYLTLDNAEHEYRVEIGGEDTVVATAYDAKLIIGSDEVVAGSDGEVVPPSANEGDDVPNEIRNFPSLEQADNAQPLWWDESDANATLTEVDLAGESITEKYERALKLVVATAPSYARQLYTYANEPRLKSGKTYSVAVDVWSVGGIAAGIRLQSSVGSLGSDSSTAAAWTRQEVEGVALNGTTIELRLEGAVGTSYFVPLGLIEGSVAPTTQLRPRGLVYRDAIVSPDTKVENLVGSAGKAVGDIDLTAVSSPLAFIGNFTVQLGEATTGIFDYYVRPNGTTWAVTGGEGVACRGRTEPGDVERAYQSFVCRMDDGQIIETCLVGSAGTVDQHGLYLSGFWEWE